MDGAQRIRQDRWLSPRPRFAAPARRFEAARKCSFDLQTEAQRRYRLPRRAGKQRSIWAGLYLMALMCLVRKPFPAPLRFAPEMKARQQNSPLRVQWISRNSGVIATWGTYL